MMPRLRKKTGQFQNSEQVGYSQGAGQEIGRLRTDPSHPANAERNAELARRAGKTVSKRTYYGATSNPVHDLDNPTERSAPPRNEAAARSVQAQRDQTLWGTTRRGNRGDPKGELGGF